jgi:hypothetical protein
MARSGPAPLHAYGIETSLAALDEAFTLAVARRRPLLPSAGTAELTGAEAEVLRRGGFDIEPRFPAEDDPLARSIAEYAALIKTSITVAEAARRLGVEPSRIRQRLGERSLYGFRPEGEWLLPAFQFDEDRVVPGIAAALRRLDPELHPIAVEAFFLEPNAELDPEAGETRPVSPRDWLRSGREPEVVVRLAAEL